MLLQTAKKAARSAAAHIGGKDISLWASACPSGFQPYRNSHFDVAQWTGPGYDGAFIRDDLASQANSYNHPNAAIEPASRGCSYTAGWRMTNWPIYAVQFRSAQDGADANAAAWEKITDHIRRSKI